MKIFISSTFRDLKKERAIAINAIDRNPDYKAIAMEKFFAANYHSKKLCLNHLENCDAMILILGFSYGTIDEDENISFTEIEYNYAKKLDMPIFLFVKQNSKENWIAKKTDNIRRDKLISFKKRLEIEKHRGTFKREQDLPFEILSSIHEYEKENGQLWTRLRTFIPHEEFFKPFLDKNNLFNHLCLLVGRRSYLDHLDTFVESGKRVALLTGRGTIGKSKILYEFSKNFNEKHNSFRLRYLRDGVPLTNESSKQLPSDKCVIVVDDAHNRSDLSTLIAIAQKWPEKIKLIFSLRLQGKEFLRSDLTRGGYDPQEIEEVPDVTDLGHDDLEKLGSEALGEKHQGYLESLIKVAKDSPLVLIVGGRLIADGKIEPLMIAQQSDFQRVVFDKFQDVMMGKVSDQIDTKLCKDLLALISILSPIQPESPDFQDKLSEFIGIDKDKLVKALDALETNGVLLRRGYSLRITPDTLSDHIINKACITSQGRSTNYASEVYTALGRIYPENVLFNLSELNWRNRRSGGSLDILEEIWPGIDTNYKKGSHYERTEMAKFLKKIAFFEPARTLNLVEYAIHNPSIKPGNDRFAFLHKYSQEDVIKDLPTILNEIAYDFKYLPRCCDLLWQLGKDDERPTNQYPEHAMRILDDLAGYNTQRPLMYNETILNCIERWLKEPEAHEHKHSPLDVLDPLLRKEGVSTGLKKYSFEFKPFALNLKTIKPIRDKAIFILEECTNSKSDKVILRALKSLREALHQPFGLYGRPVSDGERDQWEPEQLRILEIIQNVARRVEEPVIQIQISSDLQLLARNNKQVEVSKYAKRIINSIPKSFKVRIIRAFLNKYEDEFNGKDYAQHKKRCNDEILRLAKEFTIRYRNARKAFTYLNERLIHLRDCEVSSWPVHFLLELSSLKPTLTEAICRLIIIQPAAPLAAYFGSLLTGIQIKNPNKAVELTELAIKTKNKTLCLSVANGYGWLGADPSFLKRKVSIIKSLLNWRDRDVKERAIDAIRAIVPINKQKAIQLALNFKWGDDVNLAEALCGLFEPTYGIAFDNLKKQDIRLLLSQLTKIIKIDYNSYNLQQFINNAFRRIPKDVIKFWIKRMDIADKKREAVKEKYQPLPYHDFNLAPNDILDKLYYRNILRRVRNRALKSKPTNVFWLPKLYSQISGVFCPTSLEILEEWIDSGCENKIRSVGMLITDAHPALAFSNTEFVSKLIEKADLLSEDCYRSIVSDLHVVTFSGSWMGTPGQPPPLFVDVRDQARKMVEKYQEGSPANRFYRSLVEHAEDSIKHHLAQDEERFES